MTHAKILLAAALIFLHLCTEDAWSASLKLSGTALLLENEKGTTQLSAEAFRVETAQHAPLLFVGISEEQAQQLALPAGLYLFHKNGTPAGVIEGPDFAFCGDLFLSPDKKYLLVDQGTWLIRSLFIYSYPTLEQVYDGSLSYFSSETAKPVWVDNARILYTFMDTESSRVCEYDPCGPISVHQFNCTTGEEEILAEGTALCDYTLLRADADRAVVGETCLNNIADWERYAENRPVRERVLRLR